MSVLPACSLLNNQGDQRAKMLLFFCSIKSKLFEYFHLENKLLCHFTSEILQQQLTLKNDDRKV